VLLNTEAVNVMVLLHTQGNFFHELRLALRNAGWTQFVYVGKGKVHPIVGREGREGEWKATKLVLDAKNIKLNAQK
jgi:hypothetical protein